MYEYIKNNPALVSNGCKEVGIVDCLVSIQLE